MTKIKLILLLVFFVQLTVSAQVKIGDNPNTINGGSLLELETTNKGFVFPRVALTGLSSPSPLPTGILTGTVVFNTASAVGTGVGLYFWSGTAWVAIGSGTLGNGWLTGGNDNTTVSTSSFLGSKTGTFVPLIFRAQGDTVGYLGLNQTSYAVSFGVGASGANTATKSVAIGAGAQATAGNEAVALGSNAVAGSFQDIAIGANSQTKTSSSNIAIGSGAQATSSNAIAIGSGALATTNQIALAFGVSAQATGFTSMAIGNGAKSSGTNTIAYGALAVASGVSANAFGNRSNATGDSSLAVGNSSKASGLNSVVLGTGSSASNPYSLILGSHSSSTADSVIIIGNNLTATTSNVIILGGTSVTKRIGMGTTTPQEKVDIVGNVRFSGALMPNGSAGTAGQVLTSAGANNPPTWQPAISLTSFSATAPLTYNSAAGVFGITQATTSTDGYLPSTDWNTFNNKVGNITLNTPSLIYTNPVTFSVTNGSASGTLSLLNQNANTVLAGPITGSAVAPAFRALVAADIPSLSGLYIQNQTTQQASSNFNISGNGTIGTNLTVTGTSTLTGAVTSKAGITNTGAITSSGGILSVTQTNPLFLSGLQSATASDSILTILSGVVRVAPASALVANAWSIKGNTGTDTTKNFVGNTDDRGLMFKVNNIKAGFIGSVNYGQQETSFGLLANATQQNATAIGANSLASANAALALGYSAVASVQNGIALGSNAASSGTSSIAVGFSAQATAQTAMVYGNSSVASSVSSLVIGNGSNAAGPSSIILGHGSTTTANGQNAIVIGHNITGINQSDAVILSNPASSNAKVGIGTATPSYKLQVLDASNPLYLGGVQGITSLGTTDSLLTISNGVVKKVSPPVVTNGITLYKYIVSIDLPTVNNNSELSVNVTVPNLTYSSTGPNPVVTGNPRVDLPLGLIVGWSRVSATNTVTIHFNNVSNKIINAQTIQADLSIFQ
jgi:hypothetical protein